MRADAQGFFWQETPKERNAKKKMPEHWGPMPPIPATGWTSPTEFPNLTGAKVIGLDTETWDPELTEAGPGWGRGKGHIIGASLSVEDGSSWYFPIRHEVETEQNMDPDQVLRYLDYVLNTSRPKVGANLIYDIGWLNWENVRVEGKLYDVQFAEALLDSETPSVALDELAKKYLGEGKVTETLYEWLGQWNGKKGNSGQRKWLYKTPPSLAGPYAEADAALPIKILEKQWPLLAQRGVDELFDLECRLIPLLVKMRLKGAPVNLDKAEQVHSRLGQKLAQLEDELNEVAGVPTSPNSTDSLTAAFKRLGVPLPTKKHKETKETVVSFDKDRLKTVDHPIAAVITEHRALAKVRNTFVDSYIMQKHVNGRIYCSFHPLKGAENGARSGRFASSDPNLQNIPVRSDEGKLVRDMFDATVFGGMWRSFDYSSIEYRLLAHYAVGEGADKVRAIFANDPTADYHKIVGDLIEFLTGLVLGRSKVKTINFGIIYGMALPALATALNLPKSEAKKLLDDYHAAAPYARATMDMCADEVHATGHVRTILNRASDFSMWGAKTYQEEGRSHLPYAKACAKWGVYNIERSSTHKALNRKLQGSAADVMKKAMVDAYEAGLFDEQYCGIPVLTVHDELDFEDMGPKDAPCWVELQRIMETCMDHKLRVPLLVDSGYAETWRDAH